MTHTRTHIKKLSFFVLLILTACNPSFEKQEDTTLQHIKYFEVEGKSYPYIRYMGKSSEGQAFFLFPIFGDKNSIMVKSYMASERDFRTIATDGEFGSGGNVEFKNGIYSIGDAAPISVPLSVTATTKWQMKYSSLIYSCNAHNIKLSKNNMVGYDVTCIGQNATFNFTFDKRRGITKFDGICMASGICNFQLLDRYGLFSPEFLSYVGF